jgi:diguanylate cyclase (GGDEF)-like protein
MTASYEPRLVALSILVAVLTAFAALNLVQRVALSPRGIARAWLVGGALITGAGLWSMHFVGMLAFELPIPVVYHVPTMLFSLGIAVLVAFFALWIAGGPRMGAPRLALAGLCMSIGFACMHYSGLFSMQIVPAIFYDPKLFLYSIAAALAASWLLLGLGSALRESLSTGMLVARAGAGIVIGAALSAMHFIGMAAARFAPDSYCLGAVPGELGSDSSGLLMIIATLSVLAVVTVLLLTIIDHAHLAPAMHPVPGGTTPVVARDPITGLPRRAHLEQSYDDLLEAVPGPGRMIGMLAVGLEGQQAISDAHGAEAAAQLLREMAARLGALVRPGDTVVRMEEGDFVLLLANLTDGEQAARVATRVGEEVGREVQLAQTEVRVSARVGVALYPGDGQDCDTLLRIARAAQTAP